MNVPPRRKTNTGAKIWGGESNSLKPHGSRFDALERITDKFGTKTKEAFVDVIPTNKVTNKINYDVWVKIWTKSNKAKGGVKGMDLAEGQDHTIGEDGVNLVGLPDIGASSTKFKVNMMELIKIQSIDILFVCEPRIGGDKALKMVKSLGFSNFEVVDPTGFSEGLWLLWNANKVNVEIIGTSDQTISAYVSWYGRSLWIFTGIYANPCSTKRAKLWEYLNFVANCHQMSWLIAGDFNDMIKTNDKMGGIPLHRLKGFKKWFDENNMIDLGYSGPKFTWTNNRVFERIDRAQWDQGFGLALAKSHSLVEPLKHWNIAVFGHLKQRKTRLLARLNGIQRGMCHRPIRFLTQLEESLSTEYNIILNQEALFWQQKSRVKWLQEGDRNTKFFHLSTIVRRRRNKIEKLKNNVGVWVEEAIELKKFAIDYFMGLFYSNQPDNTNPPMSKLFPSLREVELNPLVTSININEVKESLFNIGSLKIPGVVRFPACFYQNQW
ncbi:PREDICTED: uncharacterized protein LOC103321374 [Prunus mume]|uniref:Uncharacterized protein LOC103321374 n=1 Tax=Prunus mume TaxID=102107 RepID=A0ABM0N9D1_PRUMU|nr:PREDICTED: uncharacterized protein LOC103321374 [Prunus mume]